MYFKRHITTRVLILNIFKMQSYSKRIILRLSDMIKHILYLSDVYKTSYITTVFNTYSNIYIVPRLHGQTQINKWPTVFNVARNHNFIRWCYFGRYNCSLSLELNSIHWPLTHTLFPVCKIWVFIPNKM